MCKKLRKRIHQRFEKVKNTVETEYTILKKTVIKISKQIKEAFLDLGLFRRFSGLRKLEGKRVVIYARSLYDQVYKNVVITERIEGIVVKVDSYGITLRNARTIQYVNDEPTKVMHTPSERVLVYHNIIDRIYIIN